MITRPTCVTWRLKYARHSGNDAWLCYCVDNPAILSYNFDCMDWKKVLPNRSKLVCRTVILAWVAWFACVTVGMDGFHICQPIAAPAACAGPSTGLVNLHPSSGAGNYRLPCKACRDASCDSSGIRVGNDPRYKMGTCPTCQFRSVLASTTLAAVTTVVAAPLLAEALLDPGRIPDSSALYLPVLPRAPPL